MEVKQIVMATMEVWGAIVTAIALFWALISRKQLGEKGRLIVELFLCTSVWLIADAAAWIFRGNVSELGYYMVRISNFISFVMPHILITIYAVYVSRYIGDEDYWMPKVHFIATIGIVMVVVNQFWPVFYSFDAQNRYYRLPLFWLIDVPGIVASTYMEYELFRKRAAAGNSFSFLFSFYALPFAATLVQAVIYGYSFLNIAVTVSVILLFLHLLQEQNDLYIQQYNEMMRQKEELQDMRFRLVKSQVQPHFIFNCLNTIYFLCDSDPGKAKTSVGVFSKFLRGSLKILDSDETIPFSMEIEHVEQYLRLEQMRFEERLRVEEDIREWDFEIPALTVQVLAENAVKHGICKKPEGGTLKILAFRRDDQAVVRVEDDGVGFDISEVGADSTGLRTSRTRLKSMCGGTLTVESTPGVGTAAEICVPMKKGL